MRHDKYATEVYDRDFNKYTENLGRAFANGQMRVRDLLDWHEHVRAMDIVMATYYWRCFVVNAEAR